MEVEHRGLRDAVRDEFVTHGPDADQRHALALWAGVQGLGVMFGRRGAEAISTLTIDSDAVLTALRAGILGHQ